MMALLSFIVGAIFLVIGGTATLSSFGIGLLKLPALVHSIVVMKYSLLVGGIMLLIDAFTIRSMHTFMPSFGNIILGAILGFLGVLPLLLDYNLLGWLPFAIKFSIPNVVLSALLTVFGLYLLISAIKLTRTQAFMGR